MTRGSKVDNKIKAKIISSYALTNSYNKTSKEFKCSPNTIKKIINEAKNNNPNEYAKVCKEKKKLFYEQANEIIDKALALLNRRFDTALSEQDEIEELISISASGEDEDGKPLSYQEKLAIAKKLSKLQINSLSEITISMGTLYDKMRLDKGESTSNTNNVVNVVMSDELKELSK